MKILCNVDNVAYKCKPTGSETGIIQNRLTKPSEIELSALFGMISQGITFRPAAINGKSDSDFISQQIFCVDIDNAKNKEPIPQADRLDPQQAIAKARAAGLQVTFCYPTFSDSDDLRKYRLLFAMDRPVTNIDTQKRIAVYISDIFGSAADTACTNPARLFYGTDKPPILTDIGAINILNDVIKILPDKPKSVLRDTPKVRKVGTLCGTKSKSPFKDSNIELIKTKKAEALRIRLNIKNKKIFENSEAFLDYVYTEIDMAQLLEINNPKKFCCILHDDADPSASIFTDRHGIQRYKCFAEGCAGYGSLNIKQIIEILTDEKSEYRALEFIKKVYNLEVSETAWTIEQKANIDAIIQCMTSTGGQGFADICPTASKTTRHAALIFLQVLNIARNNIYPHELDSGQGNIIFTMSVRQLAKACGKSSIDKVGKYLKMLIYHHMIEIVPDSDIPAQMLARVIAKRQNKKHHHTNFYRIPSWVYTQTMLIDAQGERWQKYNYRLKAISYEMFYRNIDDREMAQILYPQTATYKTKTGETAERTTTQKSNNDTRILTMILLDQIRDSKYTTESRVIEQATHEINRNTAETQLKKSINEIMDTYGLCKIRANKAKKEELNIDSKGYPLIIVRRA